MTPVLVVRGHDAYKPGAYIGEFGRQPVQVNHAVVGDGYQSGAFAEIMLCGLVDAGMFDGGNPDLALRIERPPKMVHDHVVGLGRSARPDDVRRLAAEEMRELFARFLERGAGATPDLMRAGRVARIVLGGVQPGFARLAHHGGGGVMVEINHHRQDTIGGFTGEYFVVAPASCGFNSASRRIALTPQKIRWPEKQRQTQLTAGFGRDARNNPRGAGATT